MSVDERRLQEVSDTYIHTFDLCLISLLLSHSAMLEQDLDIGGMSFCHTLVMRQNEWT